MLFLRFPKVRRGNACCAWDCGENMTLELRAWKSEGGGLVEVGKRKRRWNSQRQISRIQLYVAPSCRYRYPELTSTSLLDITCRESELPVLLFSILQEYIRVCPGRATSVRARWLSCPSRAPQHSPYPFHHNGADHRQSIRSSLLCYPLCTFSAPTRLPYQCKYRYKLVSLTSNLLRKDTPSLLARLAPCLALLTNDTTTRPSGLTDRYYSDGQA